MLIVKSRSNMQTNTRASAGNDSADQSRMMKALDHLAPRVAQIIAGIDSAAEQDVADAATSALKEYQMDLEALSKALETAEAKLETLEQRAVDAEAALEEAQEVIKSKSTEIETLRGKTVESDEEVFKALPEVVRKRIEQSEGEAREAREEVAKLRTEREEAEAIAKARDLKVGDPAVVGPLLMRVAKGKTTAEDAEKLTTLLKGIGEQGNTALLFKSFGSGSDVEGEPEELLKSKAIEIQKANAGLTYEQAYDKAVDQSPELYAASKIAKARKAAAA